MGIPHIEEKKYSREEYFELLAGSQEKYEYIKGLVRMMAGGSVNHNEIKDFVFGTLFARKGSCKLHNSDTAVSIKSRDKYYFPDLIAVCDKNGNKYEEGKGIARLINPSLIIEVVSKSTELTDRGEKFHDYCQLESFREFILIDSRKLRVDAFYKQEDTIWQMQHLYKPTHVLQINTLSTSLTLDEIYAGVEIEEE